MLVFDPAFWFWAPVGMALLSLALGLIWPSREVVVVTMGVSLLATSVGLVATAFWSWLLRDGLGPGSVESTGAIALGRFAQGYAVPFLAFGVTTWATLWACRRGLRIAREVERS